VIEEKSHLEPMRGLDTKTETTERYRLNSTSQLTILVTLKAQAGRSSETPIIDYQSARRHIVKDS